MEMSAEIRALLEEVVNDFDNCPGADTGVVSLSVINKVRTALGWQLLDGDTGELIKPGEE